MEFAFDQWMNVYDGRTKDLKELINTVYSNGVEAVVDMPHSNFFDQFLEEWPNAKVVAVFVLILGIGMTREPFLLHVYVLWLQENLLWNA